MSRFSDLNNKTVLHIPFPEEKFQQLLKDLHFSKDVVGLSFEDKRVIFLASFREFLKGNFSLDDFSEIANHVKMIFPIDSKSTEQNDYELVVYEAADVSLYIRKHEKSNNMFVGLMETIWIYFGKYKYLLDDLPEKYSTLAEIEIK